MIILQHQFWGLKVKDEDFEVTLSFRKVPATLTIPFAALTAFMDPGVQFGLQFRESDEAGDGRWKNCPRPCPIRPPVRAPAGPGQRKSSPRSRVKW